MNARDWALSSTHSPTHLHYQLPERLHSTDQPEDFKLDQQTKVESRSALPLSHLSTLPPTPRSLVHSSTGEQQAIERESALWCSRLYSRSCPSRRLSLTFNFLSLISLLKQRTTRLPSRNQTIYCTSLTTTVHSVSLRELFPCS